MKSPNDYAVAVNPKKPSDTGEASPLKTPKVKNSQGANWHGFKSTKK